MNILYGVPGEGMGHATRSSVVIRHLLKQHNVIAVSSARAFTFLNDLFPGKVYEIKGFHFAYKNAVVSTFGTFKLNAKAAPKNLAYNLKRYNEIEKKFKPDLVITDFESSAYYYAKYRNIPVISIDNMQIMNRRKLAITIPKEEKNNYSLAKNIVKVKVPSCNHYLITSFFAAEIEKKNTSIVPPIIRDEIIQVSTSIKNHILVYQSSSAQNTMVDVLKQLPNEHFIVYGFNKDEELGNITFKKFSQTGFINDLASCKAVISNGGFSLISEAVYLHKPVYSFPVKNQFEQFMNAAYIEQLGYGRHFESIQIDSLKSFLYDLETFRKTISSYEQKGNEILFEELEMLIMNF